ncbi:MAG: helix-turn-helix transcriptional regulator [Nitrospinae bacterium]|nr:helix-turn-helix transcriptional regulator [Nitrospinota bacterium]
MASTLEQKLAAIGAARRKKVESRTHELIEEEKSLRELRQERRLTQKAMADQIGIRQDGISKIEKRGDLRISTLRGFA